MATLKTIPKLDSFATTLANEGVHAPYRHGGRDYRLTDVHGYVVREIIV